LLLSYWLRIRIFAKHPAGSALTAKPRFVRGFLFA
jgi:hypothetical protein